MNPTLILYSLLIITIIGCGNAAFYEQSTTFEDSTWSEDVVFENEFTIGDTTTRYNLFLDIDHDPEFAYENIYVEVTTVFPDKEPTTQQLPINLADKKGKWYGKCGSNSCHLKVVLKAQTRFQSVGDYTLSFGQGSRESDLSGIQGMSFYIEEAELL